MAEEKIIAYVLLSVEVGKEHDIAKEVTSIEGVTEARVVYGEYDIVTRVEATSVKDLERTIMKIRKINGVLRSVTLISS